MKKKKKIFNRTQIPSPSWWLFSFTTACAYLAAVLWPVELRLHESAAVICGLMTTHYCINIYTARIPDTARGVTLLLVPVTLNLRAKSREGAFLTAARATSEQQ